MIRVEVYILFWAALCSTSLYCEKTEEVSVRAEKADLLVSLKIVLGSEKILAKYISWLKNICLGAFGHFT